MKILMVSKFRRFTGGVEAHIQQLTDLLRMEGHTVRHFTSEDLPDGARAFDANADHLRRRVRGAAQLLWNSEARTGIQALVREWRPDIIHHHSVYHQLSPAVLLPDQAHRSVMTLHDYKLAAPCYTLFRDGAVCELCVDRRVSLPAIRHKCVQGSVAASALCTVEDLVHHRRYLRDVAEFIVPSEFAADVMVRAGIPPGRLNVIRWGDGPYGRSHETRPPIASEGVSGLKFLFAGRLHSSKGFDVLLEAWRRLPRSNGAQLWVAGDGDLRHEIEELAQADDSISYVGLLGRTQLDAVMQQVDVMLVPSLFPETFGLTAVESLLAGLPVLGSTRGALGELRGAGFIPIEDLSTRGLSEALTRLVLDRSIVDVAKQGLAARDLSSYSGQRMLDEIVNLYSRIGPSTY